LIVQSEVTHSASTESARAPTVNPPGASDLAFLSKIEPLEALKAPSKRYRVPTPEEYFRGIETDDLDLDFATTEEEKREIDERKAGKVWRALRSSKNRFVMCEKVQYGGNYKPLVEVVKTEEPEEHAEQLEKGEDGEGGALGEDDGPEENGEEQENGAGIRLEAESEYQAAAEIQAIVEIQSESTLEEAKTVLHSEDAEMQDIASSASEGTGEAKPSEVVATGGNDDHDSGEAE